MQPYLLRGLLGVLVDSDLPSEDLGALIYQFDVHLNCLLRNTWRFLALFIFGPCLVETNLLIRFVTLILLLIIKNNSFGLVHEKLINLACLFAI